MERPDISVNLVKLKYNQEDILDMLTHTIFMGHATF